MIWYIATVLWAAATAALACWAVKEAWDELGAFWAAMAVGLLVPMWIIGGYGPLWLVQHEQGPELAVLLESEWRCASSHESTSITYVQSGNTSVPIQSTTSVCDAYVRK